MKKNIYKADKKVKVTHCTYILNFVLKSIQEILQITELNFL